MFFSAILTGVFAALLVVVDGAAVPSKATVSTKASFLDSTNPFLGKSYFVSSKYAGKLQTTLNTFLARKDTLNAARVRSLQRTGTFLWITSVYHISNIATTITDARAQQKRTGQQPIIGLVLYNLPDRDCSGGQSTGEFTTASDGLNKYKAKFVDAFAVAISKAPDLTFAIILEPDSLGNLITNQNIPFCARAKSAYESGIAYAIAKLQQKNVFLYLDAAHGGWLGWDANLPLGQLTVLARRTEVLIACHSRGRNFQDRYNGAKDHQRCQTTWICHQRLELQSLRCKTSCCLHRI